MRRSVLLQVHVYCPHFQRSVEAMQNTMIGRLVSCQESERCREVPPGESQPLDSRPYPTGCPVFPSLAR